MRKKCLCALAIIIPAVFLLSSSAWPVPRLINYQGKLADSSGVPMDGSYNIRFSLYNVVTGGINIWNEEQDSVEIVDGFFSIHLGSEESLPPDIFNSDDLYLEIAIENPSTDLYETLSPRLRLTSTPYSMNADTLDGQDSTDFAAEIHTHSFSDITGNASDAQIPNNIKVNYAATAGDADTVDGLHADEILSAGHNHDARYYTKAEVDSLIAGFEDRIAQLEAIMNGVTRTGNDIEFSGVNVHIVNGTGTTNGAVNGLGNLIVGYNEGRGSGNDRSGSHNIVAGSKNNYSSFGGLVIGYNNTISGRYASVSGGYDNTVRGPASSVSGGYFNFVGGESSSISGGFSNSASGLVSSVSGGENRTASDENDWVARGLFQDN